jgi:chitodextrinase
MDQARWRVTISTRSGWLPIASSLLAAAALMLVPASARAALGYELDTGSPFISLGPDDIPHGLAVDQSSRRLYVAVLSTEIFSQAPGKVSRFESNRSAAGTFGAGAATYYSGVAVNPLTQGFYGAETRVESPFGSYGTSRLNPFSSTGVAGTPFSLSNTGTLPQIATDSSGQIYYPNALNNTVQVFSSSGTLQETITCAGCPGGAFGSPVSVALNSEDDLYVADLAPDRIVKFTLSSGSYVYDSSLQSGRGAAAVAVDPSTDDVFVGDLPGGKRYHIVAYDSSGNQFDDFGAGLFTDPQVGAIIAVQIAVDATSHELYVGELGKVYVFDRVTISPPTAVIDPASAVGQLVATLNATVNAKGHAVLDCDFEYVTDAQFQSSGFTDATSASCSKLPDGTSSVAIKANASGLLPSTQYRYRVSATSNAGTVTSANQAFTTLPSVPPTVTTDPATGVTETTAILAGRVNPHGGTVSDCHFEFGTTGSYGQDLPCKPEISGPVTNEVARKVDLKGLSPDTTYHFRLVVTSNAGTTQGSDVAFATPAPPAPTPTPESPPPPAPEAVPPLPAPAPLTCRPGFVKQKVGGTPTCVRKCRKGFVKKRVGGKVRCVRRKAGRRAGRR